MSDLQAANFLDSDGINNLRIFFWNFFIQIDAILRKFTKQETINKIR